MSKKNPVLSTNLYALRKALKLSQAELALNADVSERVIRDLESGKSGGSLPVISKIAEALHTSVDELLTDYEVPESERSKVVLTPSVAADLGLDFRMLTKIAELGPEELKALSKVLNGLHIVSSLKSKTGT